MSRIQKSGNIKPAVLADSSIHYNPLDGSDDDDPKMIEDIVRDIARLDKAGHEQIYISLRKTKSRRFFAVNNVVTHFNIYGLSSFERRELKRIIKLCIEDMERKKVLEHASDNHINDIAKLDEQLESNYDVLDDMCTDSLNPSEAEKIKEMLQMNQ